MTHQYKPHNNQTYSNYQINIIQFLTIIIVMLDTRHSKCLECYITVANLKLKKKKKKPHTHKLDDWFWAVEEWSTVSSPS